MQKKIKINQSPFAKSCNRGTTVIRTQKASPIKAFTELFFFPDRILVPIAKKINKIK